MCALIMLMHFSGNHVKQTHEYVVGICFWMVIIVLAINRKQYHHVTIICIISPLQVRPSYCKRNPSGQPYK